ncbi:MAG: GDP-mannose 4,6-dehydratase [Rhodocyclales bacterium]|nr:GDP-mannose 4,6-dehydratase [Rhodocyclales bacterium]
MKKALITGVAGQDGAYMTRLLLDKGYVVYGTHRQGGTTDFWRLSELGLHDHPDFHRREHDLSDLTACIGLIAEIMPDEIYNLASLSFAGSSFGQAGASTQINGIGAFNLLEAIRQVNPGIRFYQASTSEMFGKARSFPQNEDTPFCPRNPYGVAKLYAHWMTVNYREQHDIFAVSGIAFNHESPLRGPEFVTRKITNGCARIALGDAEALLLGNLDAKRDWGCAQEYVECMWRMLQADVPDTFVLASNRMETVRGFAHRAFEAVGIALAFRGEAANESAAIDAIVPDSLAAASGLRTGQTVIRVSPDFYRPAEEVPLIGDPGKAGKKLDWHPRTSLDDLCRSMVAADVRRNQQRIPA